MISLSQNGIKCGAGGARPPRGAGGGELGGGLDRREVQSSPRGAIVVGVGGGGEIEGSRFSEMAI